MCEPTTIAMAALTAVGEVSAIGAQNAYSDATYANATQAANDQYASNTAQYIEQNRSLIQGGFDQVLAGRSDAATAYTSAIESGVQGASVKAVLRDRRQKAGRSAGRTAQEMASLKTQSGANLKHIGSTAQGRINSAPKTSFGIGSVAKVLTPIVRSQMD